MGGSGYAWAISAGVNAACAAIAAKFVSSQIMKYGFIVFFNIVMWGCYVNSLKALSSLQATVTNFSTNFLSSGLAGFFLFNEPMSAQWFLGAVLIVLGVLVLSKSSVEKKKKKARGIVSPLDGEQHTEFIGILLEFMVGALLWNAYLSLLSSVQVVLPIGKQIYLSRTDNTDSIHKSEIKASLDATGKPWN